MIAPGGDPGAEFGKKAPVWQENLPAEAGWRDHRVTEGRNWRWHCRGGSGFVCGGSGGHAVRLSWIQTQCHCCQFCHSENFDIFF